MQQLDKQYPNPGQRKICSQTHANAVRSKNVDLQTDRTCPHKD
jgi:hypothetical protein